jgi:hypothetical protein
VGADRTVGRQSAQGELRRVLALGHETRERKDGSRYAETDRNDDGVRIRAEGRAIPGGGCRVTLTALRADKLNMGNEQEERDLDLEVGLLEVLDPAAAARVLGKPPPPAPAASADAWDPVRHLVGTWRSEKPAGTAWTFEFTSGGQFLEVRGSSILGAQPAAAEEMGRISRDAAGGRLVWRQFTAGGQVNQYVLQHAGADALVFLSESPESLPAGSRARLTLGRAAADEILAVFEIAEPGKGFAVVGESRIHRVR